MSVAPADTSSSSSSSDNPVNMTRTTTVTPPPSAPKPRLGGLEKRYLSRIGQVDFPYCGNNGKNPSTAEMWTKKTGHFWMERVVFTHEEPDQRSGLDEGKHLERGGVVDLPQWLENIESHHL